MLLDLKGTKHDDLSWKRDILTLEFSFLKLARLIWISMKLQLFSCSLYCLAILTMYSSSVITNRSIVQEIQFFQRMTIQCLLRAELVSGRGLPSLA